MRITLPRALVMAMLLSGTSVALSACQTPEGAGRQASVTCPIVSGPNESPVGSMALSRKLCQERQQNIANGGNGELANNMK